MHFKIVCVGGARPNFMKLAPLVRELERDPDFRVILVHTGQHYSDAMSQWFFRDLGLRLPDCNLEVGSASHAQQTAEILRRFEPVLLQEAPHAVVVVGDVNSTVACALAAKKLGIPLIHVEAGLRSFDRSMPEEINRLATDSITDLFLITENSARCNLLREGVAEDRIHLVGNLMIDSLAAHREQALRSDIPDRLRIRGTRFGLLTLHRPANVDDPARLQELLDVFATISRCLPLYFPVHPRTRARMEAATQPPDSRVQFLEPLGYLDFLCMMSHSEVVLTDSGGIQEETTALGIPCLTLRENTERPVTVEEGTNILAGTTAGGILAAWEQMRNNPKRGRLPAFWDGSAAPRCRKAIQEFLASAPRS